MEWTFLDQSHTKKGLEPTTTEARSCTTKLVPNHKGSQVPHSAYKHAELRKMGYSAVLEQGYSEMHITYFKYNEKILVLKVFRYFFCICISQLFPSLRILLRSSPRESPSSLDTVLQAGWQLHFKPLSQAGHVHYQVDQLPHHFYYSSLNLLSCTH